MSNWNLEVLPANTLECPFSWMVLVAVKRKGGLRYSILDKKITSDIWECSITWHLEEVGNGSRVLHYFCTDLGFHVRGLS